MAISKERKEELLQEYAALINKSEGLILVEYRGLTMKGMDPLRTKVREASGELHVVKNTLARKALTTYAKDNEFVKVKGALLGGRVLTPKEVEALAELPPLPVVRAQLLGLLAAPASRLTGTIASGVRQVGNVVKAYAEKDGAFAEAAA